MIDTERVLQTFLALSRIDNPSTHEGAMVAHVMERLHALGLDPQQDAKGNVIAVLAGEGEPLLLNAHLDSVAPTTGKAPVVDGDMVRSGGDTVLGADDLAGVAAILEGVQAALVQGNGVRAAEIVFTVEEEIGLVGARELDYARLRSRVGVALDHGGEVGSICVSAPAQTSISVTIHGRAAHAGVAPEEGIDAVRVAAQAIAATPLGRIDHETTANIGIITGGAARNIVPERVEITAEARSRDEAKLHAQVAAMHAAFEHAAEQHGARLEWVATREYGPLRIAEDAPIVRHCQDAIRAIGLEPTLQATGGGSDVNIFNMHGIEAVNLGIGYRDIHSTGEHIAVRDIENAARLVEALLTTAA
jgi:tripeptide aminopeptidase